MFVYEVNCFTEKSSAQAVMLAKKTVIYNSRLLDFSGCSSLAFELYISNTDFMDRLYLVSLTKKYSLNCYFVLNDECLGEQINSRINLFQDSNFAYSFSNRF